MRRVVQEPRGGDFDQLAGDLADAVFHPRLARLPGGRAEPVKLDARALRAVAREELDILDRQEQLVAAGIMDFQAVVRRARGLDGAQADKAADAVIDVNDNVARRKARDFGNEIFRALALLARPDQALAENVLLGDQRDVGGLEAGLHAEHGEACFVARPRQHRRPRLDHREVEQPVFGEHVRHALARAFAPERDDHALVGGLQRLGVRSHGIEDVGVRVAPFGGEIAPGAGRDVDGVGGIFRRGERRQPRQRHALKPGAPFVFGEIKPVRLQRLINRAAGAFLRMVEGVLAGLKIVGDLGEPLVRGLLGKRFEHDRGRGFAAEIIEQRLHLLVKQRQPMLHARGAAAFAHGFVENVVGRRGAERRHIAGAKAPDGVAGELKLGHGHELERAQFLGGALRFRIEAAN